MTVGELAAKLNLKTFNESDFDREITCGYCGDLLSWVMGRAKEGCVWFHRYEQHKYRRRRPACRRRMYRYSRGLYT